MTSKTTYTMSSRGTSLGPTETPSPDGETPMPMNTESTSKPTMQTQSPNQESPTPLQTTDTPKTTQNTQTMQQTPEKESTTVPSSSLSMSGETPLPMKTPTTSGTTM